MELERAKMEYVLKEVKEMENDQSRPSKRKRVVLTLEDKLEVVKSKEEGRSYPEVAKIFNIGTTTVKDIMKNKESLMQAVNRDRQFGINKKIMVMGRKPKVEERLYMYVIEKNEKGEIVTNKDLIEQARLLTRSLYNEEWTPSPGWVGKFKNRYSINTNVLKDIAYDEIIPYETEMVDDTDDNELNESIDELDQFDVEEPEEPTKKPSVSILNACDILIDFMTEHNFALKDTITVRVIREKINQMPEAKATKYEVYAENCQEEFIEEKPPIES